MTNNQALMEFLLNKICPYLILVFLLFYNFEMNDISLYVILVTVLFIDWYSGRIGRAMGAYDNNKEFKKLVDDAIEDDS